MMSSHLKGLLLTVSGVLVLTPDSLLIRLAALDHWTLLFWRGLLMALGMLVGLAVVYRRDTWRCCLAIGKAGLVVAGLFALSTIFFVTSITHTSVANTLVIVSASPLFAAIFSRVFLHEPVERRTWLAIVIAMCAIGLIVAQSLAQGSLFGDLCAVGTAIGMAGSFVAMRYGRAVNMIPASALSGVIVALVMLPLAQPLMLDAQQVGVVGLLGLIVLPVSFALITLGPRYLPAPEVSLILLLETALGPLWVWLALGEIPTWSALVGGTLLLLTLIIHSLLALRPEAGLVAEGTLDTGR